VNSGKACGLRILVDDSGQRLHTLRDRITIGCDNQDSISFAQNGCFRRKFQNGPCLSRPRAGPPWSHRVAHLQNSAFGINHHNVNGKPHPMSVNRSTWSNQQPFVRRQLSSKLQATKASPEGRGQLQSRYEHLCGVWVNELISCVNRLAHGSGVAASADSSRSASPRCRTDSTRFMSWLSIAAASSHRPGKIRLFRMPSSVAGSVS